MTLKKTATNLREVLESLSEDPDSWEILVAETAGRAIGLVEGIYLYCPDGRRFIESVLGTSLKISSEYLEVDSSEFDAAGHVEETGHSVKAFHQSLGVCPCGFVHSVEEAIILNETRSVLRGV